MAERPILFGQGGHLMGILSLPADDARAARMACLMLNVGVTHRIGPRRFNVKLARQLLEHGVTSLRFDLSGIGDSATARGRVNFREQTLRDMQAAMDCVRAETGIDRFVIFGLCSGAVNGYWLAQVDPRVVGLMMFDGFAYPTLKTRLVHDWAKLQSYSWRQLIERVTLRLKRRLGGAEAGAQKSIFNSAPDETTPSRDDFAAALNAMSRRGVSLYIVYSGSLLIQYNYDKQVEDVFSGEEFMKGLRLDYWPDVDHIATSIAAQRKLLGATCDWVCSVEAAASRVS